VYKVCTMVYYNASQLLGYHIMQTFSTKVINVGIVKKVQSPFILRQRKCRRITNIESSLGVNKSFENSENMKNFSLP